MCYVPLLVMPGFISLLWKHICVCVCVFLTKEGLQKEVCWDWVEQKAPAKEMGRRQTSWQEENQEK